MTWEKSGEFVESDVVEWTEAIWPPNHSRRRKKSRPWGKQKVTAQITAVDGDFVKLTILRSAIVENIIGSELKPHKVGTTITKKRQTLLRGEPERLLWSEEDVRKALLFEPPSL
ncbi:MAG: hypothetical protein H3C49_01300 [Alphaproteobacteria bacterium]|nr:hypothetical protein [Alphaproteobacteria bacterium]